MTDCDPDPSRPRIDECQHAGYEICVLGRDVFWLVIPSLTMTRRVRGRSSRERRYPIPSLMMSNIAGAPRHAEPARRIVPDADPTPPGSGLLFPF